MALLYTRTEAIEALIVFMLLWDNETLLAYAQDMRRKQLKESSNGFIQAELESELQEPVEVAE